MTAIHPVIEIQTLIDELKECTQPISTEHQQELNVLWGQLEDKLIMLATKDTNDGMLKVSRDAYSLMVRKAANWNTISNIISQLESVTDVNSDEETGGGSGDR